MNYQKIYNQICQRGQTRKLPKEVYTEKHHIIPRCLDGPETESNLTNLTANEHFICHRILSEKLYPNHYGLTHALFLMCNLHSGFQKRYTPSARIYAHIRERAILKMRGHKKKNPPKGKKNGMYGKRHTEEAKRKMSEARKKRRGYKHSEETKRKISETQKASWTPEKRKAFSKKMQGRVFSEEHLANVRAAAKRRTIWNKGKKGLYKHSPEVIRKMKLNRKGTQIGSTNSNARPLIHVQSGQVFRTRKEAAEHFKICLTTLGTRLKQGIFRSLV